MVHNLFVLLHGTSYVQNALNMILFDFSINFIHLYMQLNDLQNKSPQGWSLRIIIPGIIVWKHICSHPWRSRGSLVILLGWVFVRSHSSYLGKCSCHFHLNKMMVVDTRFLKLVIWKVWANVSSYSFKVTSMMINDSRLRPSLTIPFLPGEL